MISRRSRIHLAALLLTLFAACATTPDDPMVVREVRDETLLVEIPRSRIRRILHATGAHGGADRVFLEGRADPLEGAVVEPTRDIILMELGADWEAPAATAPGGDAGPEDFASVRDALRKEVLRLGSLEGRMLKSGEPLPECKVRVVLLDQARTLGIFTTWRPRGEYLAITNDEGLCRIEELPEGNYKIFWWPPWEDGWVRRIEWQPDVFVSAHETTTFESIETARRVLR